MQPPADADSVKFIDDAGPIQPAEPVNGKQGRWAYVICILMTALVIGSIRYDAPPRFDETGYLILAQSLVEGRGYREIDRPGAPVHAHFPPGWPVLLATCWSFVNESSETRTNVAHGVIACLWLLAIVFWNRWYARSLPGRVAIPLTCALAANWLWIRLAGELRSESLFNVLTPLVLVMIPPKDRPAGWRRWLVVGFVTGLAILTRQVGVGLAAAVMIECLLRGDRCAAFVAGVSTVLSVAPWVVTQIVAGQGTQAELLADGAGRYGSIAGRVFSQVLFYVRRLPDSLFGPFVETATVFRDDRVIALAATAVASAFAAVWILGVIRMLRDGRLRPGALYLVCSQVILFLWPFTEAGRFLIPLIPLNLVAVVLGCESFANLALRRFPWKNSVSCYFVRLCRISPMLVLLAALPFGLRTGLRPRLAGPDPAETRFDTACRWIREHVPADAVISARHPGDLFWRSGRVAVPWPSADSDGQAVRELRAEGATYVLVDTGRYVGDQVPSWLTETQKTGERNGSAGSSPGAFLKLAEPAEGMAIYQVRAGGGDGP